MFFVCCFFVVVCFLFFVFCFFVFFGGKGVGRPSSKSGALEDGIEKKNSITFIVHNLKRQMGGGNWEGGGAWCACMCVCMHYAYICTQDPLP